MTQKVDRAYFLLADLSGFTAFLADSELDHAQGILEQVLDTVVANLTPTMTLSEVEGDAIFVYGLASRLSRGELIAELVEVTYVAFRDLQRTMLRNATCPCRACESIGDLDLKFVTHFGEFALQEVAGHSKLIGSAVNVAHRLLKNRISEDTGWHGYALYSAAALDQMDFSTEGFHRSEEAHEHIGTVEAYASDLHQRYREIVEGRRIALTEDEADAELVRDFDMPPAVVWDWLNDPPKRSSWMPRSHWLPLSRARGRTGTRATNHCTSYKVIEEILDWRPFDYYTVRFVGGPLRVLATISLEPRAPGTRVRWKVRLENRVPRWVGALVGRAILYRRMRLPEGFDHMSKMMKDAFS